MNKKGKKTFNWGIIGTGGIANAFSKDLDLLDNHIVTAVLSRTMRNAKDFSENLENCKTYDNIDNFLRDEDICAVYIATPNTLHCIQTIKSLEAKIPVLCEKPFAMNFEETNRMIECSRMNSTALLDGMWMRYLPHIIKLKDLLSKNAIGNIESIYACHGQNLKWSDNPRLWTKELGGGALLDLGIYVVSFCHMIAGSPEEIFACSVFTSKGIDSKTSMVFKYDNGVIANLSCSMYDSQPNRAIIAGSDGYIEIDHTFYAPTTIRLYKNDQEIVEYKNDYEGHGLRQQAKYMEKCVSDNKLESDKMTHKDTLEVMKIMDDVRRIIGLKF
tara:strand:- start:745 stop:1731 length:987 start_codon:yes stop_codon:yes gene_type:complete